MSDTTPKIALVVIYNHRYDKNIPIVEKVYRERFSHIYHVMPFYDGDLENVIPVYESSFFFQGYIAQAYQHIKNKGFTHFMFLGDDVFLEPSINEDNLHSRFKLSESDCYLPNCSQFHLRNSYWRRTTEACMYTPRLRGVELNSILPSIAEALAKFKQHSIGFKPVKFSQFFRCNKDFFSFFFKNFVQGVNIFKRFILSPKGIDLEYPTVGGHSDIFLATASVMPKFTLYLGAFAATKLFVEIAIPTALYLSSDCVKTNDDIDIKGTWSNIDFPEIINYNKMTLDELITNFPKEYTYLHPVKFSKWA